MCRVNDCHCVVRCSCLHKFGNPDRGLSECLSYIIVCLCINLMHNYARLSLTGTAIYKFVWPMLCLYYMLFCIVLQNTLCLWLWLGRLSSTSYFKLINRCKHSSLLCYDRLSTGYTNISLFLIKMIAKLERKQIYAQENMEQTQNPTMGATI